MNSHPSLIACLLALALLTACTATEEQPQPEVPQEPQPVSFGTYVTDTRALVDTDYDLIASEGFGVFAYYTTTETYPASNSSYTPNFMYNQQVTCPALTWQYTPVKFWPNDNQPADNAGAQGSKEHSYVSFFAYAPYNGTGFTLCTEPSDATDPQIGYSAAGHPYWDTDLVWGVNPDNGLPQTNRYRTDGTSYTSQEVKFKFLHALARLGVEVQAAYDGGVDQIDQRKILIETVSVSSDDFQTDGRLNLNNTVANEPRWTLTSGSLLIDQTTLNSDLLYTPLTPVGIPNSGQDDWGIAAKLRRVATAETIEAQFRGCPDGVLAAEAQPLQAKVDGQTYFYTLIPRPGASTATVTVSIRYHVITLDPSLPYGFSDIVNDCTASTTITTLAAGRQYTLLLSLGLTSMTLQASATAWP